MNDDNPYLSPQTASSEKIIEHAGPVDASPWKDGSFWGMVLTQFLGAFNDNLYKQAILLLMIAVPVAPGVVWNMQGPATFCFSVPFILFSGYAGYLSDRHSKWLVIFLSKVAEIVIMGLALALFFVKGGAAVGVVLAILFCVVAFLMGTQSAFFGPGKYGILPELFTDRNLPMVNGVILMTTFLAIIFGTVLAGVMLGSIPEQPWIIGLACVAIAGVGTATTLPVRRRPGASPQLRFSWDEAAIPRDMRALLRKDSALLSAVTVSSIFWMGAAVAMLAVNDLGELQLKVGPAKTSYLVGIISVGIAVGGAVGGFLSKGRFRVDFLAIGAWGMTVCLVLLSIPLGNANRHLLGYWGSLVVLGLLGGFTGLFAVPLQVFLQMRPPTALKGRMIGTQNLLNWIGITAASLIHFLGSFVFPKIGFPHCAMFGVTAILVGGIALLYHPKEVSLH
jgi:MFS family permease